MHTIITQLRTDLANSADEKTRAGYTRFFREAVVYYGVKSPQVKAIARKYWRQINALEKAQAYALFEAMLAADYCEEAFLVAEWLPRMKDRFARVDLAVFAGWIDRYLNNWAKIDSFCNHAVADFLEKFPESIDEILRWRTSENRWMKRASAVTLILPARRGGYLREAFTIADTLLRDPDDMVQKGYGWLLKEASRQHQREVFEYVMQHKAVMPRTALRYAIELMPAEMRAEAMKKG